MLNFIDTPFKNNSAWFQKRHLLHQRELNDAKWPALRHALGMLMTRMATRSFSQAVPIVIANGLTSWSSTISAWACLDWPAVFSLSSHTLTHRNTHRHAHTHTPNMWTHACMHMHASNACMLVWTHTHTYTGLCRHKIKKNQMYLSQIKEQLIQN